MNRLRSLLCGTLIFVLIHSAEAHGRNPKENPYYPETFATPIETNSLKILGRGIVSKKTKQHLFLACVGVDLNCDTLQFAYFQTKTESYWIGKPFQITPFQKRKKTLSSEVTFKKAMRVYERRQIQNDSDWGAVGYFVAVLSMVAIGGATGSEVLPIIGGVLIFLGLASGAGGLESANEFSSWFDFYHRFQRGFNMKVGEILLNQGGWNWSEKPVRMKERRFGDLVYEIHQGRFLNELNDFLKAAHSNGAAK